MVDTSVVLDRLRLLWETEGGDVVHAAEIYHDDAVVEFPQSGERFEGIRNFTEWRSQYPASVGFRLRRVTVREDLAVCEISASYDGGAEMLGVQLLDFADGKAIRERIYVTDPWEAPEWRAPWRADTPADRPGIALSLRDADIR
jgi:SnoaL-like domain